MANKIYVKTKDVRQVVAGASAVYTYCMGLELRDGTSGAVVPATFLQTDECTAAFVGVLPYGGYILSSSTTSLSGTVDSLVIKARPLGTTGSADVSVTIDADDFVALAAGAEVTAGA